MHSVCHYPGRVKQRGAALMVMLIIMVMGFAAILAGSLSRAALQTGRDNMTADALAQAREALLGDAVSPLPVSSAGYLRLPDLGFGISGIPTEGSSAPNFTGNNKDYSVIGKLPWKTLGISPLRSVQEECIWYVVSGRLKNTPATNALNWDTQGQIDVIDGSGNIIVSNAAALLVAPGKPLDGQGHALSDPAYMQCGGNYDARNYLDSYNSSDAVANELNYFAGSVNNRIAPNSNNKKFVMTNNDHYNDRFLFITVDDIFRAITRRSDFSIQISALLDDAAFAAHLRTAFISGTKGTDHADCSNTSNADNKKFCKNWKEMLLLTQLPLPSPISIDGALTPVCTRVLIFGGQKTATQTRLTAADKTDPANYLEAQNLAAFATPNAVSGNFSGISAFSANNASNDLLRCL